MDYVSTQYVSQSSPSAHSGALYPSSSFFTMVIEGAQGHQKRHISDRYERREPPCLALIARCRIRIARVFVIRPILLAAEKKNLDIAHPTEAYMAWFGITSFVALHFGGADVAIAPMKVPPLGSICFEIQSGFTAVAVTESIQGDVRVRFQRVACSFRDVCQNCSWCLSPTAETVCYSVDPV